MASTDTTEGARRLGEVVRLFLKLGIVGFGGDQLGKWLIGAGVIIGVLHNIAL